MMKHLNELNGRCCRWVIGPVSDLMYCGKPALKGASWCGEHFKVVFVQGTKPPMQNKKVKHPIFMPVDMIPPKAPADLGIVAVPELEEVMLEAE
jgi:hypothetical protein